MPTPEETDAAARELATHTVAVDISIEPPMGAQVCPSNHQTGVGLQFAEVLPGSNAEKAGIERGDIVLTINGIAVVTEEHAACIGVLQSQPAGPRLLQVARVVPGEAPAPETPLAPNERKCTLHKASGTSLGIQLAPATADGNGLVVHALSEAGVAKQGGVNKGDEIATIFGTNVQSMPYDQAIAVISSKPADADGGMTIELTLLAPGTAAEKNGGGGGRGDGDDGVAAMEFTISTAGAAAAFFPPPGEALVQLSVDGSTGLGFEVAPATADGNGLVVVGVAETGLASKAGICKGDVVSAVNGASVTGVAAAKAVQALAIAAATGAVSLTLVHPVGVFEFAV